MPLPLSPQEQKLYGFLLQDLRMKEISNRMGLDPSTIDTYAKNVYRKKGVETRIGLIIQFYTETTDKTLVEALKTKRLFSLTS